MDNFLIERIHRAANEDEAFAVLERVLDVTDERPYARFIIMPRENRIGFPHEVLAYNADGDEIQLPDGIKRFYRNKNECLLVKMCLDVLAVGRTKTELDGWHSNHPAIDMPPVNRSSTIYPNSQHFDVDTQLGLTGSSEEEDS